MNVFSLLNVPALATALIAVVLLLAVSGLVGRAARRRVWWPAAGGALMPLVLGAGFLTFYLQQFPWPHGQDGRPWYLDEAWKMACVVAVGAAVVLAVVRLVPKGVGVAMLILLVVGVVGITVRGPWLANDERPAWDAYGFLAAALAASLALDLVCFWPVWREPLLRLVGPLVMWASLSAAGVLVMLAVLAGLAAVAGLWRPWRVLVAASGPFLAVMFSSLVLLAYFYRPINDPPALPAPVWLLLAAGPGGAAWAWWAPLRRRPWLCTMLATGSTLLVEAVALFLASRTAPPPMG